MWGRVQVIKSKGKEKLGNRIQSRNRSTLKKPSFASNLNKDKQLELGTQLDLEFRDRKPRQPNINNYNENENVLHKEGLYVWGASENGGIGVKKAAEKPTEIILKEKIDSISIGDEVSFVITNLDDKMQRKLYYAGRKGFLSDTFAEKFEEYPLPKGIKSSSSLACHVGRFHALLLEKEEGKVFGMGSNAEGQLGADPHSFLQSLDFTPIDLPEKIVKVIASYNTSVALSESGNLYVWGKSFNEAIGMRDDNGISFNPSKYLSNIRLIDCSHFHSVAVDKDNKIIVWGKNSDSQIGDKRTRFILSPKEFPVNLDEKIIDISCGIRHNLLLTESNKVFSWGGGQCGQLGRPITDDYRPAAIPTFDGLKVLKIYAGEEHNLAVTQNDKGEESLWSWGNGSDNQLGFADRTTKEIPTLLKTLPTSLHFHQIYAGFYNSAAIIKSNS